MKHFNEMLRRVTSSVHYDKMLQFIVPLKDHFGINHFWYYKITHSGHYTYFGSNAKWSEFCFNESLLASFPCLRHPTLLQKGISLMKAGIDLEYKKVLKVAWEKFQINFGINVLKNTEQGIEAFGFATCYKDSQAEERLLNHLPLLTQFTKMFHIKHKKIFQMLDEDPIDLPSLLGTTFYKPPKVLTFPSQRDQFLRKIGFDLIFSLTPRELTILKYIANGFPAPYIAEQLQLSSRTVENYLAAIKSKLHCSSKIELIQKALEIASTGYLDNEI